VADDSFDSWYQESVLDSMQAAVLAQKPAFIKKEREMRVSQTGGRRDECVHKS
jgi:hypothetical protein